MEPNFTLHTTINRNVADVFAAIVEPSHINRYFTDGTSGPLIQGSQVTWRWHQWGENPVVVKTVIPNSLILLSINSIEWEKSKNDSYEVEVRFELEALEDDKTLLTVSETGWKTDDPGLKASHENCGGWQHMMLCLKAYLEYEIDLRQ